MYREEPLVNEVEIWSFFLLLWRFTAKLNQIYEAEHWLKMYQFYRKDLNGCDPVQHLASSIRHCKLQIPMQYL